MDSYYTIAFKDDNQTWTHQNNFVDVHFPNRNAARDVVYENFRDISIKSAVIQEWKLVTEPVEHHNNIDTEQEIARRAIAAALAPLSPSRQKQVMERITKQIPGS
jgi:hypothetical protein